MTAAITGTSATADTASSALAKSSTLGMNDFLKLMTTQLQTQDPFNPMDNSQMAAQLAQFSSVAGISEMNASLKGLAGDMAGSRVRDAAGWIGRNALVPGANLGQLADGSYAGEVTLPAAAANVTVNLVDGSGRVVHTAALGAQPAGTVPVQWDGRDPDGAPVAGPLKLVVSARDAAGAAVAPTLAGWAPISGVQSPATGTTRLVTGIGLVDPATALQLG